MELGLLGRILRERRQTKIAEAALRSQPTLFDMDVVLPNLNVGPDTTDFAYHYSQNSDGEWVLTTGDIKTLADRSRVISDVPWDVEALKQMRDYVRTREGIEEDCEAISKQALQKEVQERFLALNARAIDVDELIELLVPIDAPEIETPLAPEAPSTLLYWAAMISPRDQRDALIGCLTERYHADFGKWGAKRARRLMARDFLETLVPTLRYLGRRAFIGVMKLLGLNYVVKYFLG
jgi:hypothetical protein